MAVDGAEGVLRAAGSVARRQRISRASRFVLFAAVVVAVGVLSVLAVQLVWTGGRSLSWDLFLNYPSRFASRAGLRSSILGTFWILLTTVIIALPISIGTAIWIEEFAPRNRATRIVRLNIANLAGVPSIIYGVLGLAVFVRFLGLGPTIIAGALTLALMIMPMTVIAASEAIRQVPQSIRDASMALGATRWQTVWFHVIPNALPGIMTGTILAISRAAGETAALIMIGASAFIAFDNTGTGVLLQEFTAVPVQVYNWTIRPQPSFRAIAAAGSIVLMVGVVGLNLIAVVIRERFRRTW